MTLWVLLVVAISFSATGEAVHVSAVQAIETREQCERVSESVQQGLKTDKPASKIIAGCFPMEKPFKA